MGKVFGLIDAELDPVKAAARIPATANGVAALRLVQPPTEELTERAKLCVALSTAMSVAGPTVYM